MESQSQNQIEKIVLSVLGNVDAGKTTLFNTFLRKQGVKFEKEYGGITQNIRKLIINVSDNLKLIMLDTPGHEYFVQMRWRAVMFSDLSSVIVNITEGIKKTNKRRLEIFNSTK